jgi:hypothetical protein
MTSWGSGKWHAKKCGLPIGEVDSYSAVIGLTDMAPKKTGKEKIGGKFY